VPLPLVIVHVLPEFEHEPLLEKVTGPAGAVAATPKLDPNAALGGACAVTVIAWFAFAIVKLRATSGAVSQRSTRPSRRIRSRKSHASQASNAS